MTLGDKRTGKRDSLCSRDPAGASPSKCIIILSTLGVCFFPTFPIELTLGVCFIGRPDPPMGTRMECLDQRSKSRHTRRVFAWRSCEMSSRKRRCSCSTIICSGQAGWASIDEQCLARTMRPRKVLFPCVQSNEIEIQSIAQKKLRDMGAWRQHIAGILPCTPA
jgi:hypothetical protein